MDVNKEAITIRPDDSSYPVGAIAPTQGVTLTCVGNLGLLNMKAIGICGSRNASADALKYARSFGSEAAKRDLVVVSGYARGIDREAHKGTLESGGRTIAVLPEGIKHFRLNRELKPYVRLEENFLAVSMFPSDARWQAWRAMERNNLIVGLSSDMFVIEARDTGGTINAAMECVRQGKRLWAIAYSEDTPERAGNRILIPDKAIPLKCIRDVKRALDDATQRSREDVKQIAMTLR